MLIICPFLQNKAEVCSVGESQEVIIEAIPLWYFLTSWMIDSLNKVTDFMLYFHVATNNLYGSSYFWWQIFETAKKTDGVGWGYVIRKKIYKVFLAQNQEYNHEQVAGQI